MEVFVPFADLESDASGTGEGPPAEGTRWRLNCTVTQGDPDDALPVACWGAADTDQTEIGAILIFGAREGPAGPE